MKVSWKWLSELADLDGVSPDEAARLLPLRVVDVEGVERLGGLEGVVTAKVLKVEPHPGADRLRLCTVDFGAVAGRLPSTLRVVCGAPNVAEGQVVCFAPVGVTLPNGLTLKKAKIRGVDSEGMICAEDEMGLGTSHDGIVVLPAGTPIGRPVAEVLGLADVVLDLNNSGITSRPDLWGHVGVARELAAIFGTRLRPAPTAGAERAIGAATGPAFPVEVRRPRGVPAVRRRRRRGARERAVPGPAPAPPGEPRVPQRRPAGRPDEPGPARAGPAPARVRPPRAARGPRRRAPRGGGRAAGDPRRARRGPRPRGPRDRRRRGPGRARRRHGRAGVGRSRRHDVAAARVGLLRRRARPSVGHPPRDADRRQRPRSRSRSTPIGAATAARRFVELVLAHVPGARVTRAPSDVFPRPYPAVRVDLPRDLVRRRLGVDVPEAEIVARLASVGFSCEPSASGLRVTVPSWRATKDVSSPEDLVEEVGRLHGYEHVVPCAPLAPMTPHRPSPTRALERDAPGRRLPRPRVRGDLGPRVPRGAGGARPGARPRDARPAPQPALRRGGPPPGLDRPEPARRGGAQPAPRAGAPTRRVDPGLPQGRSRRAQPAVRDPRDGPPPGRAGPRRRTCGARRSWRRRTTRRPSSGASAWPTSRSSTPGPRRSTPCSRRPSGCTRGAVRRSRPAASSWPWWGRCCPPSPRPSA